MRRLPSLLLLAACTGPAADKGPAPEDDTGDTDTGDVQYPSLAEADAAFLGDPSSAAGSAVAGAGDLDGDGLADLVVTAFYANRACVWRGPVADGAHALTDGACLEGEEVYDFAGYAASRASLGGQAGIAVSAIGNDAAGIEAGKVYLLWGAPTEGATPLADAPVTWVGEAAGDYAGSSLADPGDLDGDGFPELLIGASGVDAGGSGGGRVYVVHAPLIHGEQRLADAPTTFTGTAGIPPALAHGAATGGDALGDAVAGLGDIDGDGFADLLLGASGADGAGQDAGEVWIVRGPVAPGDFGPADADARLAGPGAAAYAGGAVAGPGDLDGDGLADLAVAADGWEGGYVYVLLGPMADGEGRLDAAPIALAGEELEDVAGWSVSGAGDTDGDGRRELLVGAPGLDVVGGESGGVYLVHAPATLGVWPLADVAARWTGEASGDAAGRAAAGLGDVDGDGLDDLLTGALYNQDGGVFAGKAYLLRGR